MTNQLTTAAALATELDRAPDRIGAIARKLGFARIGRDWLFSKAEADAIRRFVRAAKPGRRPTFNDPGKK